MQAQVQARVQQAQVQAQVQARTQHQRAQVLVQVRHLPQVRAQAQQRDRRAMLLPSLPRLLPSLPPQVQEALAIAAAIAITLIVPLVSLAETLMAASVTILTQYL